MKRENIVLAPIFQTYTGNPIEWVPGQRLIGFTQSTNKEDYNVRLILQRMRYDQTTWEDVFQSDYPSNTEYIDYDGATVGLPSLIFR